MGSNGGSGGNAPPVRAGLGLLLGCASIFWSAYAPVGAATAYAYKALHFTERGGGRECRSVQRGEQVSIWPASPELGERLVRLVDTPECFARLSDMSVRPRPALRPLEAKSWRFALIRNPTGKRPRGRIKRYTSINARREPDLDSSFIIKPIDSVEAIRSVVGIVTGSDSKEWLEVTLTSGETAYIKRYGLEII